MQAFKKAPHFNKAANKAYLDTVVRLPVQQAGLEPISQAHTV